MGILAGLVNLVLAPRCLGCGGAAGPDDGLVCGRCRSRLVTPPHPLCRRCGFPLLRTGRQPGHTCQECDDWPTGLRSARSACLLREPADTLAYQLKYRGWHGLGGFMGRRLAELRIPPDVAEEAGLVVPVPTTPLRVRSRGYNQAEVLAEAFGRADTTRPRCWLKRSRRKPDGP